MKAVTRSSEIADVVQPIKQAGNGFATNFFAAPAQVERWIGHGEVSYVPAARAVLIFRRDRGFFHLYHVAADGEALSGALGRLAEDCDPGTVLVSDLVGREADAETAAGLYRQHGFSDHARLVRMARTRGTALPEAAEQPASAFAERGDLRMVCAFLEEQLDPFRDQMPETDEVEIALERRSVLIERRAGGVGGLLLFETTGWTSLLRYWYVEGRFRGQGIGARLIKTYFRHCRTCGRIVVWVASGNADAIARYRHYGFRDDVLADRIMIRRGSSKA